MFPVTICNRIHVLLKNSGESVTVRSCTGSDVRCSLPVCKSHSVLSRLFPTDINLLQVHKCQLTNDTGDKLSKRVLRISLVLYATRK
jgi:hypothetical protein